jgi:multisubunit Na+/H+ antiporter MnhB subunit
MAGRRSPESRAREALVVLGVGLVVLTGVAAVLYRPGSARWTHVVVDGTAWALVGSTGLVLMVCAVEKLVEIGRRHLSH